MLLNHKQEKVDGDGWFIKEEHRELAFCGTFLLQMYMELRVACDTSRAHLGAMARNLR